MNPTQFIIWLDGYIKITGGVSPNEEQWEVIKSQVTLLLNEIKQKDYREIR
jgi:hypothetical protein